MHMASICYLAIMNFLPKIVLRTAHWSSHVPYPVLYSGSCFKLSGRWTGHLSVSLCRRHSRLLCGGNHYSQRTICRYPHSQFRLTTRSRRVIDVSRLGSFRPDAEWSLLTRGVHSTPQCHQSDQIPPVSPLIKTVWLCCYLLILKCISVGAREACSERQRRIKILHMILTMY